MTSRAFVLRSAILVLIASSLMVYAPTDHSVQRIHAASSDWMSWANTAWRYFQPDVGVIRSTGLSTAGVGYPYFTEWDLGTYIFAIVDAEKIKILSRTGNWGSTYRLDRIMAFLSVRQLTSYGTSYVWYSSDTGDPYGSGETNVSDLGFLLIALYTLKTYRPEYAAAVNGVIARENITRFASSPSLWQSTGGIYKWYVAHGFKLFGFDTYDPVKDALSVLETVLSGPQLQTYDVTLPVTSLTSEPLLLASFTIDPEPGFQSLVLRSYLAQQNRYAATAKFTAFSEGNTDLPEGYPGYVYEWIVTEDSQTWILTPSQITPIIYIKVGFGFYGLFGNQYALDVINHVKSRFTDLSNGYMEGVDENGRIVSNLIDRTQGITLAAARYALKSALVSTTISSSPTGRGYVTIDGSAITTPQVYTWTQGASYTLAANSPVSGGTGIQYVWVSWSDSGAQSHTITVPSSPTTYTANFKKQYMLTVSTVPSGGGSLSVGSGWRDDGTTVSVTATPSSGYSFSYWSLDGTNVGTGLSYSVVMNSAHSLTAFFRGTSSISVGLSAGSIALGASVTLSGTITPTQPSPGIPTGTTVTLSYSLDGATWNTFITNKTSSGGAYSIVWYPPYPNAYQIKASWSGNADYGGSTSSAVSLTVTGTFPPRITLLISGPPSAIGGSSVTFDVIVTNPGSAISTTLYFEVLGPSGYWYFDTQQISVATGGRGILQFAWQVPSAASPGQYQVFVGLIPTKPTAIAQTQITVT